MPYRADAASTEVLAGGGASATALIDDDDELAACVAALGVEVGIDTEFIRVRTFFPIPALYQLAGDGGVALVDAQAKASFDALRTMLVDPERTKVVHACSEDLEVIEHHLVCDRATWWIRSLPMRFLARTSRRATPDS